ncbi:MULTISPECIES: tRNA glutamyl-Q(34) synthetase GluQRS [unclassified Pseudoalteromonas]|uniref:tRNA glutamyl-Q(34) synthetase GluQRS n=1 Tax=unclassified Pseudoalteromonas TaxID=194690 RepID=UPI000CF60C9C|nr:MULTISPECIES: tRNA glutamyl-Q(34) synthetase GluQRS [unclassified Pseudoalteromonas]MBS3798352.1 tRNA glutamyl-Q(34) synthetase GluQRS [Pseudoalteromonas sp. BDTF-M6]
MTHLDGDLGATPYVGRFAPSPSGPLHFGSLVAALGSYLDAHANQGQWLVRIEDIDTPRVRPGADTDILHTLEAYGLHWHGEVVWQSQRLERYAQVSEQLRQQGLVYGCQCSRKEIKALGGIYNGHCRDLGLHGEHLALRLKQQQPVYHYLDALQGRVDIAAAEAEEDYIIKRRDGLFAYQLVVVIDDIDQGITQVVRGADLLIPTARQIGLFQQLEHKAPEYLHLPLAVASPGFKLSKQNYAPAIDRQNPQPALLDALCFLGFTPPPELATYPVADILNWAQHVYQRPALRRALEVQVSEDDEGNTLIQQL